MSRPNSSPIPTPFLGLRMLLVDNETTSLLSMATELELHSYRVTTTELATVALSILRERKDNFDLIIADTDMPEMDCFDFIKSARLIKDFPIILISTELKKDMVKEAVTKGVCFCLEKPISAKNLKNVWQHVCRMMTRKRNTPEMAASSNNLEQANFEGLKVVEDVNNALDTLDQTTLQGSESQKMIGMPSKRSVLSRENDEPRCFKRKRTENEDGERATTKSSDLEMDNLQMSKPIPLNERDMEGNKEEILEKRSH